MKLLLSLFVHICDSTTSIESDQTHVTIATLNTQHIAMKWVALLIRNKTVQYSNFNPKPAVMIETL
jgi:hypothetical protein